MKLEKVTTQVEASVLGPWWMTSAGMDDSLQSGGDSIDTSSESVESVFGYEIHMGVSRSAGSCQPLFRITRRNGQPVDELDGLVASDGRAWGTYIHGVFDNDLFRREFLMHLRAGRGDVSAPWPRAEAFRYRDWKEEQYDRLAAHVRRHCDVTSIYRLMGL
jgi:adenosylcobyric acid synthase